MTNDRGAGIFVRADVRRSAARLAVHVADDFAGRGVGRADGRAVGGDVIRNDGVVRKQRINLQITSRRAVGGGSGSPEDVRLPGEIRLAGQKVLTDKIAGVSLENVVGDNAIRRNISALVIPVEINRTVHEGVEFHAGAMRRSVWSGGIVVTIRDFSPIARAKLNPVRHPLKIIVDYQMVIGIKLHAPGIETEITLDPAATPLAQTDFPDTVGESIVADHIVRGFYGDGLGIAVGVLVKIIFDHGPRRDEFEDANPQPGGFAAVAAGIMVVKEIVVMRP